MDSWRAYWQGRERLAMEQLKAWVGVNSHTRNAGGVERHGEQVASVCGALGFEAERPDSGIARCGRHLFLKRRGTGARSVALVSHLDTVFPAAEEAANGFRWQPENDRLYGPGIYDIKGGTLMALLVLERLRAEDPGLFEAITWHVALNATEEILHGLPITARSVFSSSGSPPERLVLGQGTGWSGSTGTIPFRLLGCHEPGFPVGTPVTLSNAAGRRRGLPCRRSGRGRGSNPGCGPGRGPGSGTRHGKSGL